MCFDKHASKVASKQLAKYSIYCWFITDLSLYEQKTYSYLQECENPLHTHHSMTRVHYTYDLQEHSCHKSSAIAVAFF